jgi:hypothetical protein
VVADLVLIALGIALQPFRLSAFILILSTDGGTKKGLGFILGWLICLVLVIAVVVLITGGRPVRFRTVPSTVVVIIKLALGIALIVLAAVQWRRRNRARRAPAASTQLAALRDWLEMHGNEVIIIVCLVLGVWLAGQSVRLLAIEGGR